MANATTPVIQINEGNVGIGTTSPTSKLQLKGDSTYLEVRAGDNSQAVQLGTDSSGDGLLQLYSDAGIVKIKLYGEAASPSYINAGNFGIGTTNPTAPLHFGKTVYGAPSSEDFFRVKFFDNGGIMNDVGIGQPTAGAIGWNIVPNSTGYYEWNSGTLGRIMNLDYLGKLTLDSYDSTNNTGTPTYLLGTDASGNVVKTNTVPGSGAGPYLPLSAGSGYPLTGGLYIPSYIYHAGDTNALFGFNGQDIFIINTNGGRRLTVTNTEATFENNLIVDGNVGIGTTNPAQNFVVADATNGNGIELVPAGTGTIQAYNRGTSLYNTLNIDSLSNRIRSVNETVFNNGSGFSESMRILSGGNVGIGVTSTSYKLEVGGASKISGNVIIGTDPNTYANLTLKDATTASANSKSLFIWSQNSGRSFLSLVTASTGEAQIGFGTSQYASQNTSGSIQYTQATSKFTFKTNYTLALTIANNQAATFSSTVQASGYKSSDGTAGITGTMSFVDKDSVTRTITYKNGLVVGVTP